MKNKKSAARSLSVAMVRRARRPKYKMARFPGGWNYRGYCVYRKHKGNAEYVWQMADESGDEWAWFFRTLAEFRRTCDRWERQRAKEAAQSESSPNNPVTHDGAQPRSCV